MVLAYTKMEVLECSGAHYMSGHDSGEKRATMIGEVRKADIESSTHSNGKKVFKIFFICVHAAVSSA